MSKPNELEQARKVIDEVDKQMALLFEKRMNAAKQVASYKKKNGLLVEDAEREKALVQKMLANIENEELKTYYIGFIPKTPFRWYEGCFFRCCRSICRYCR